MSALVYPKFIGRLANNMFQIAACIGYAKKYGVKWGIKKGYVEQGFQANQVDRFMPDLPYCGGSYRRYSEHQRGWDNEWFNYHEIPCFPEGVELVGFFQSEKYFENAKNEVRSAFEPYIKWRDDLSNYCAIHVRRGDYVQHADSFPPVTVDYLNAAMFKMLDKPIQGFVVCSDDIEWCKANISPSTFYDLKFMEGSDEWTDFCAMASCGHHIMSNSTFSWWSSWLGRNPQKTVISPSHKRGNWFGFSSGIAGDCVDLLPKEWEQIQFR